MFKRSARAAAAAIAFALTLAIAPVFAQDPQPQADDAAKIQAFLDSLHFRSGDIAVGEAKATFHLGDRYRYLEQAEARRVLEELWGNPPDDSVLGLIVPNKGALTDDDSWAVVVTYSDDGYVSDKDANETDYAELLKSMKQEAEDSNSERAKQGYPMVHVVGWATPPRYDMTSKKLYWAKEIDFVGTGEHTLNYDIRVLGRHGYLSLNAISVMSQLDRVQSGMQDLLPLAEFDPGARYADYNDSTDKVAGYGIAALIAGGIAAKSGLLAKLGVLLLAGKKFIILIFAGIAAFVRKLFGKKDG